MTKVTMPFGRHKGKTLDEIPNQYLEWCLSNVKFKSKKLKEAIEHEMLEREYGYEDATDDWLWHPGSPHNYGDLD